MPDIAMCKGLDCPKKEKCYRFTATPSEYQQSYFTGLPTEPSGECNYYIKMEVLKGK